MKKYLGQRVVALRQKIYDRLLRSNESGAALVASILFAATVSVLAVVAFQWASGDIKRTGRYVLTREAFYIAEAGLQKSLNFLNYNSDGEYPGDAGQGFTEVLGTFVSDHSSELESFSFGGGTYTVSVADNDDNDGDLTVDVDNTILLNATGTKDSSSVTIQAILLHGIFGAKHAITTEDDLQINGNPNVQGTSGSIHSNSDITGNSNDVEQGTTAAGVCDSPCVEGAAKEVLPVAEPADFKTYANFVLTSEGTITDADDSAVDISENKLDNWSYTDTGSFTGWVLNGCSADGMFFAETSIKLTGNVDKCSEDSADSSDKDKDKDSDSSDKDKDKDADSGDKDKDSDSSDKDKDKDADSGDKDKDSDSSDKDKDKDADSGDKDKDSDSSDKDKDKDADSGDKDKDSDSSDKDKDKDADSGDKDKDSDSASSGDALKLTLIAEEDIIISGNPNIENYKNDSHPEEIQNLLFVSGLDLDFGGNLTQSVQGVVIAKEQISLTGSVSLSGYIIASDVTSSGDTVGSNSVSGNFEVTYNGLKNPFLNDQVTLLSWKEK